MKNQIIDQVADDVRSLLTEHYAKVHEDALEVFRQTEDAGEPVCKVSFAVQWVPERVNTKLKTKISWTVSRKEETETTITDEEHAPSLPFEKGGV